MPKSMRRKWNARAACAINQIEILNYQGKKRERKIAKGTGFNGLIAPGKVARHFDERHAGAAS